LGWKWMLAAARLELDMCWTTGRVEPGLDHEPETGPGRGRRRSWCRRLAGAGAEQEPGAGARARQHPALTLGRP